MKIFKRTFILIVLILLAAIFINAKTRFFKDIGKYIPYLETNYPFLVEYISDASDYMNEAVSHLPTIREIIAEIKGTEVQISAEDVANNIYYSSDSALSFYPDCNISVQITDDNKLSVYGINNEPSEKYIVYRFLDESGEVLYQATGETNSDGSYASLLDIPDTSYQFTVFTGPERYGQYTGYIVNYIYITYDETGTPSIEVPPVFENNRELFEKPKSKSAALKSTYSVCSDLDEIVQTAASITAGIETDYDKALAIHDWVCENIYYDEDSIYENYNNAPYVASDVLTEKRAVCLGYANLYAALCRSVSIPCNVVTGYALGVLGSSDSKWNENNLSAAEANHAWNEVYLNDHWVIVDTTWDSRNKIENGQKITEGNTSHLYFDSNLKFFSTNHKIFDYQK